MRTFGVVSLGCDKNRVDTEHMISNLLDSRYQLQNDPENCEILIVNTCGFITSAKEESIAEILNMIEYKKNGTAKFIVVTGCLSQRYMDELAKDIPEVDLFLGTASYDKIGKLLDKLYGDTNNIEQITLKNDINDRDFTKKRYQTTPSHYAYLRIAEGCNNRCSYCFIPYIRGNYTSVGMDELVDEAKTLASTGFLRELIVVAQDVTYYGYDIDKKYHIVDLLEQLERLNIDWIRLLYCYPELVSDELIDFIIKSKKIVNYLDIPFQHVSDNVLVRMGRKVRHDQIIKLIEKLRKADPNFTIRSTFIVGFPNETEEDFKMLLDFLKKYKLDRVGFFKYSQEEGTPAAKMSGQISEQVKQDRYDRAYKVQNQISEELNQSKINKTYKVLYEGIDYENELFYGRAYTDTPMVDNIILFESANKLEVGNFYNVKINLVVDGVLVGEEVVI